MLGYPKTGPSIAGNRLRRVRHASIHRVSFKETGERQFEGALVTQQDNTGPGASYIEIPARDLRRWTLALRWRSSQASVEQPPWYVPKPLADHISNFPRFGEFRQDWALYLGFGAAGFIYGGLHCAAWNAPFSTDYETFLWRFSSLTISTTGALLFVYYCQTVGWIFEGSKIKRLLRLFGPRLSKVVRRILLWLSFIVQLILLALFIFAWLIYAVSRGFLVVECFLNLTRLPDSAYQVPQWTQYLPSIS